MKTPLGTEVDIGAVHNVLDGFPALCERGTAPPLLCPCLLWPRSPISATAELLLLYCTCVRLSCVLNSYLLTYRRWLYIVACVCCSLCLSSWRLSTTSTVGLNTDNTVTDIKYFMPSYFTLRNDYFLVFLFTWMLEELALNWRALGEARTFATPHWKRHSVVKDDKQVRACKWSIDQHWYWPLHQYSRCQMVSRMIPDQFQNL